MANGERPRSFFLRRSTDRNDRPRRPRLARGVYILPSLFTLGNMFCGYACIVYAIGQQFETAAPFIGFAIVLDMLDGRIARMTGTASAFGVELDSLADVISFGIAPAILSFSWGLQPLGRLGWATGFLFLTAAAMRLARFNIQSSSGGDKRHFVGMPSPAAAAVPAATVFVYPYPWVHYDFREALPALAMVLIPAVLMVSTIRFRSFKNIDMQARRPARVLLLIAAGYILIISLHKYVLVVMAYAYLMSPFVEMAIVRFRHRGGRDVVEMPAVPAARESTDRAAR
jgi:CDP-diacylglycerol--serine O-phosphatidyltransferase